MNYLRLYFIYLKKAIVAKLEYKKDTIIGIIGFLLNNAASVLSIYFIINSIPSLYDWNIWELGFLYGFTMIPVAIDHFFSDDLWCVAYWKVRTGEMDRYYLRPLPVLFQVIAETFQPEAFGELIVGVVMLSICGIWGNLNIAWSFGMVLMIIVASIFGALLITSVKIITAALAFYMKRSGPLTQIVYNFIGYTKYPLKIYPQAIRFILQFIFPFALVISFPVDTLLHGTYNPYLLILIIIALTSVVFIISILFWSKAAKRYQSSGS